MKELWRLKEFAKEIGQILRNGIYVGDFNFCTKSNFSFFYLKGISKASSSISLYLLFNLVFP